MTSKGNGKGKCLGYNNRSTKQVMRDAGRKGGLLKQNGHNIAQKQNAYSFTIGLTVPTQ